MHDEVAHHYKNLNDGMTHLSVFFPNLPTEAHRLRNEARAEIGKIFSKVIKKRRKDQAAGGDKPVDYLQLLIDAKYRDGKSPTDTEITGLLVAALFAGQHTSS